MCAWMAAHLWKIWFLKYDLFFPRCPWFLIEISGSVPVFLKNIMETLVVPQDIPSVTIFHCIFVLCCMLWRASRSVEQSVSSSYHTVILFAFQTVRPIILTVFGNIAFFSNPVIYLNFLAHFKDMFLDFLFPAF